MTAARHVFRIYIRAEQERVWQAITDPSFTRRYFHDTAFESTLERGSGFRYVMADGTDAVEGTVEQADAPNRLVLTWRALYDPATAAEPPSRVEFELEPCGDGITVLTAVHGDLGMSPATSESVGEGWVWILDGMKSLLETGEPLPRPASAPATAITVLRGDGDSDEHRRLAVAANGEVWELLGRGDLDDDQAVDLVRSAYASAYHWARATGRGPENEARAEYLIAKAHVRLDQRGPALEHARRCHELTTAAGLKHFDLAYAHEIMARALALAGEAAGAEEHRAAALAVPIEDDEDRAIVESDLADLAAPARLTGR